MTASAPAGTAPLSTTCPRCGKELPPNVEKCSSCGRYLKWKGWVLGAAAVFTFVLAAINNGGPALDKLFNRHSKTDVAILGAADDGTLLLVAVANTGKKNSFLRPDDFKIEALRSEILEFGTLTWVSPEDRKAVPPGANVTVNFDVSYIRATQDVTRREFWTLYGEMPVTLTGKVQESGGSVRTVTSTVRLNDVKRLVQRRADPL